MNIFFLTLWFEYQEEYMNIFFLTLWFEYEGVSLSIG
jgi:hypothetical protein